MIFTSDNAFGVSPEILDALARVNGGGVSSYGADDTTKGLTQKFSDLFEREVAVFPLATGTAAKSTLTGFLPDCRGFARAMCIRCSRVHSPSRNLTKMAASIRSTN